MNVGGRSSFDKIKFANPIKGEAGRPVEEKPKDMRLALSALSQDSYSEFSPARVLTQLEQTGKVSDSLMRPYRTASFDNQVASKLKSKVFDPVINYAQRAGRIDLAQVRSNLTAAIMEHIEPAQYALAA